MNDDQDLCLCFHVSTRKVKQFIRVRKPSKVSQLSECYGAGTGCGWCRKMLERMLADETTPSQIDHAEYRDARAKYRKMAPPGDRK